MSPSAKPTSLTFSSEATRSSSPATPALTGSGTLISALASGWRTLSLASVRAWRPRPTSRLTSAMAAPSSGSAASRAGSGQSARWTESGASGSTDTTSPCHSSSAVNGAYGASSSATVRRQVQRVRKAASASVPVPRQKRRRDSRTYQLDRSSTKVASRRAAPVAS